MKNLKILWAILLLAASLLTGCKKETMDSSLSNQTAASSKLTPPGSRCQLTNLDWGGGAFWHFHYNEKGLADEWIIDNADGFPHNFTMQYDENNRLIGAKDHFNNTVYTNIFKYAGSQLIEQTYTNDVTSETGDKFFTYNKKGDIVREDDIINDVHVNFVYGPMGCIHWDLYFGSYHFLSNDITFEKPNRNPLLSISGIDFGFAFANVPLWDKRQETSDHLVVYDSDNNPFVIFDTDPAQTVMQPAHEDYLSSVNYYDKVNQTITTYTFTYQNCDGQTEQENLASQPSLPMPAVINKNYRQQMPLVFGSQEQIKEQINKLKIQYEK
ncbi:MAG TPA: hypothetical protein VEV83_05805 [Parafilimonas sp.]|nr:hypothetical protein [Parafilimonas sp.]